jgi:FixJ family two-component response regulator
MPITVVSGREIALVAVRSFTLAFPLRMEEAVATLASVIHIVDDDESFRTALARLLRRAGYDVVTYASADDLLRLPPSSDDLCCILLDVQMPGLDGPELQDRLLTLGWAVPIVFLTGHGDIPLSVRAIKAGAEDFLTKPVETDKLLEVLDRALVRHQLARQESARFGALQCRIKVLTQREREVFDQVVRGRMNKQIAHDLGVTERTVKAHRHNIMEKTGALSVAELVSMAERLAAHAETARRL